MEEEEEEAGRRISRGERKINRTRDARKVFERWAFRSASIRTSDTLNSRNNTLRVFSFPCFELDFSNSFL